MPIVKAIISMTVLLPQDEVETLQTASLSTIEYHVTQGSWIAGGLDRGVPAVVPKHELQETLQAIGNDGSFFDDSDVDELALADED